jgi:hypothetical protein
MVPTSALLLSLLQPFAVVFTAPSFAHALTLVQGALLASGRRTVTAALRAVGGGEERHFTSFHRVLNRNRWSSLRLSRILLQVLVTRFLAADAPLVLLVDSTLERRWGRKIGLKGRYHDAVRSQTDHVATSEGIQWLCLMLLVPSPRERPSLGVTCPDRSDPLASLEPEARQTTPHDP